jgi:hypothetical protein
MNLLEARKILELPENWEPETLKKNYHRLAKKYHPDKCKDPLESAKFLKIQEAYEFILNPIPETPGHFNFTDLFGNLNDILKAFSGNNFGSPSGTKEIKITPKEYYTGTKKEIKIETKCGCEQSICSGCAGGGYTLNGISLETCMECLGNGTIKCCVCDSFQKVKIEIQKQPDLNMNILLLPVGKIKLVLTDPDYTYHNGKMYYRYPITLKESLVGFTKTFNDPFGNQHTVTTKCIVKQNDGYLLKFENSELILLFTIIYPKKIPKEVLKALRDLDF